MAINEVPFAHHFSLSKLTQSPIDKPTTYHSLHTRKYLTFTSTVTQFETCSKSNNAHLNNNSWVLKNVTLLLQSMDLANPDECTVTYALIFQRCPNLNNLELGIQVHTHLIVCGVELCAFLGSQLLEVFCKFGCVNDARTMFEKMPDRNVFSWTSMMGMYNVLGYYEEIVNLFYLMIDEGVRPDHFVCPKVYKACSELKDYRVGKDVYDYMISIKFEGNACVKRPLLDMFFKCRRMEMTSGLFEEMEFKGCFHVEHDGFGLCIKRGFQEGLQVCKGRCVA